MSMIFAPQKINGEKGIPQVNNQTKLKIILIVTYGRDICVLALMFICVWGFSRTLAIALDTVMVTYGFFRHWTITILLNSHNIPAYTCTEMTCLRMKPYEHGVFLSFSCITQWFPLGKYLYIELHFGYCTFLLHKQASRHTNYSSCTQQYNLATSMNDIPVSLSQESSSEIS